MGSTAWWFSSKPLFPMYTFNGVSTPYDILVIKQSQGRILHVQHMN